MAGNIWVVAEQWRGEISEVSFELLALGREVADQLGVPLEAVLMAEGRKESAGALGKADVVLYADHSSLAEPIPDVCAEALVQLAQERRPRAILVALTNVSMGIGTLAAAKLSAPGINFCTDLKVADGRIEAQCVLYGGKMEATVTAHGEPAILGIWPGARSPEKGRATQAPAVEDVTVTLPEPRVRLKRYLEPEAGDIDISQQDALVAVGRGIQSKDNVALAEELAETLGGAICGSRPVIDQGWLPLSRQVGKSGLSVKPRLYVAAGVSGAPEHVEGMKNASLIVAINSDPQAPIFNVAHYGIVGDAMDVLPALTEAVRARKG
ncbi:MAG TPA: electron transfer flavoprotein subunit alpha/FixB family protein [Bryobacteraceae bacterium]|nr:electron transfer flavoprotein subunit alpha/FixB family protein [Bryobacteraceae bacterium]